jgi:hypothetical protein
MIPGFLQMLQQFPSFIFHFMIANSSDLTALNAAKINERLERM